MSIAALGAAASLAAVALAMMALLGDAAPRAADTDRRQLLAKGALHFLLTAAAAAIVALLGWAPLLQATAAVLVGALLVTAADQLRRVVVEFATAPAIGTLEAANALLQDELTWRAASEADLARKNDEVRRANETLKEAAAALRASEDRLAIAVEAGRIGLWDWNIVTGETWCSPQWFAMIGRPNDRADRGFDTWRSAVPAAEAARVRAALKAHLEADAKFNPVFRITMPDGAERWLEATGKAHRDAAGVPLRMAGAVIDITQTMMAKEELRRSNEELEQFARAASHDLREPLRKILFFSDFLARDFGGALTDAARRDLDVIGAAARRMETLIGGFLALARIGAGAPALAPIDPEACIKAALDQVLVPPDRAVRFAYEPLPPVLADRDLLVQVFQNLISNALKFARPAGGVEIAFTAAAAGEDTILGVADNGIGVPPAHRAQIFEPLTRLHSHEAYDGAGIGLALCKKSLDRLGGVIWMEESASGGAHVRMRLRRAA